MYLYIPTVYIMYDVPGVSIINRPNVIFLVYRAPRTKGA